MFNFSGVLSIKKEGEIIYEKKDTFTLNRKKTSCKKSSKDKIQLVHKVNT
ncbi:hypothetical protein EXM36_07900 [Clostridium botulinum]|uniref:Uncharacterized protein n=1 Tax=Clostridium botulinum (strain Kyoto / Type A2) TaxID=536232 RepID=C1FKD6_CLOBJ|nr:hypothetical protein [Clostridium botulinum]ACO86366.1 conserved hypothetical protein [Clostridium botulinum A2 str. Kyoto]APH21726.1 hypothetical protein NPD1_532 [Clostridium botulinum]APQ67218.1 hypothetical protein RSJ8_2734 [Clostridium botulinum]APQ76387.1 hypothetical protein RSJ10_3143 [Clostridium botulinum]AUN00315.1 hypothetical protein RSJ13_15375 [Clostridium botulinum]